MKHYAKSQARFTTPAIIIASIFLAGLLLWSWSRIVATQAPQPAISFTHNSLARSVAFSPDRALLASGSWGANNSDAGEVKVWDTRSGALLHTLKGHTSFVNCAAFSPDGRVLASGGEDKAIKLWNAQTGKLRGTLQADYRVMSMTFSLIAKLVSAGWIVAGYKKGMGMSRYRNQLIQVSSFTNFAGEVSVWDIGTNRKRLRLALPQQVDSVALSPDGKLLATGNGSWFCPLARPAVWRNEVRIYDIGTGGLRRQLSLNDGSSRIPVAFSPSGKGLVTGNGNTNAAEAVIAWNMRTGTKAWAWTEQKSPLSLAFSPDGSTVASGNGEGRITLIKGQTGQLRGYIGASAFGIWGLAFSSDSKRLASGADEAMIKIWDLPP